MWPTLSWLVLVGYKSGRGDLGSVRPFQPCRIWALLGPRRSRLPQELCWAWNSLRKQEKLIFGSGMQRGSAGWGQNGHSNLGPSYFFLPIHPFFFFAFKWELLKSTLPGLFPPVKGWRCLLWEQFGGPRAAPSPSCTLPCRKRGCGITLSHLSHCPPNSELKAHQQWGLSHTRSEV